MPRRRLLAAAAAAASTEVAWAGALASPLTDPLEPPDCAERGARIRAELADAARPARLWTWSWGIGWIAAVVGPVVAFFLLPIETDREHEGLESRQRALAVPPVIAIERDAAVGLRLAGAL